MSICSSEFIPEYYHAFSDDNHYYLAMEFAPGGDSYSLIKEDSLKHENFKRMG
jgi:serine/threonine protein kinase